MPDPVVRSLTVATDLQSDSKRLLQVASDISRATGAGIHLLHVLEVSSPRWAGQAAREARLSEERWEATRALEVQTGEIERMGGRIESATTMTKQPVHATILEQLERSGAGLLIASSHARPGRGHRLGSTIDRLLRTSPVPILVIRGAVRRPFRRVAALTDFSPLSLAGVRPAATWLPALCGEAPEAELELVHVGDASYRELEPGLEALLEDKLEKEIASVARQTGIATVAPRLVWGTHPVDEIERAATKQGYDLLVLATHGQGPIKRALIGSVAMGLAQGSPCPVLIVPPA